MSTSRFPVERTRADAIARLLRSLCADALHDHGLEVQSVDSRHGDSFEFILRAVPAGSAELAASQLPVAANDPVAFPPSLLGRRFQLGASTYIFRGIDDSSRDYPVVVEDAEDGSRGGLRDTPSLRAVLWRVASAQEAIASEG